MGLNYEPYTMRKWGERNAPCKGCVDRFVGCHSGCERYAAFKEQNDKERNIRTEYIKQNDMLADIRRKRVWR